LALNLNTDGLPIPKRSRNRFWTILGNVSSLKNHNPYVIGVSFRDKKPEDANEFFRPFVDELKGMNP
ncbi:conserved hypothetical protein, partial [Ixodes scapularis]